MASVRLDELLASPTLRAAMPLVYVAWADGILSSGERRQLDAHVAKLKDPEDRRILAAWLDPEAPPSSSELLAVYQHLRRHMARKDARERGTLVDLGASLVDAADDVNRAESAQATHQALSELELALGIHSSESTRHYFSDRPAVEQNFQEADANFSVSKMTALLDGDAAEDWRWAREVCGRPDFAISAGLSKEAHRGQVRKRLMILTQEGIGRLSIPKRFGGKGARHRFVKRFEALGMHDLSLVVKAGVQFGLFGGAIENLGGEEHQAKYLPDMADGRLLGGFAMTELGHGSNVRNIETVARYDQDRHGFVLHTPSLTARKEWIGNAAEDGQAMVVFAQLEVGDDSHGVHAFFVPVRDGEGRLLPGVHIEDCGDKMGLNGVDNGRLWFDNVELPAAALLSRYGALDASGLYSSPIASSSRRFFTMLGTLVGGRVSVAAAATTASKVALATAIRYAALRRQFGPEGGAEVAILDYPSQQRRLMPFLAATYVFHVGVDDLQQRWRDHEGEDTREIESLAAGVKALATWNAIEAAQAARECCGGMGFLSVNRISQMRRDLDVFATFEGDNTVLLQLVARGLLTGFSKQLADDFVGTLLGAIASRAKRSLFEQNPIAKRKTDPEHLLDADFHQEALAFRTQNLLILAARRFRRRTSDGMPPFEAMLELQTHLLALARAHTEQHLHETFASFIAAQQADKASSMGPEGTQLEVIRRVWSLWRIHSDIGWYLENDYLDGKKARAIRKLLLAQCAQLRTQSVHLVDAFAIPDACLGPIAFENYSEHVLLARRHTE